MRVVVAGAGGFIGGHLTKRLLAEGHDVVAVDIKSLSDWSQVYDDAVNEDECDLSNLSECMYVCEGADRVFMLAADMGGMGFIENNKLACMLTVLPSTNMLLAASQSGVQRFFYASSACVYNASKQESEDVTALKEEDAYPAMAEDGYGWEKLFTERMCRHFAEETDMEVRIARFHNVYGPYTTYDGGREKAPAAICRKVLEARDSNSKTIEIWGDGLQTRSFMYVDDCVEGILRITDSDYSEPLNLGSDRLVSINELVTIVQEFDSVYLDRTYDLSAPQGVRGRNSDNTLLEEVVGWTPSISLEEGLDRTYMWIESDMFAQ